MQPSSLLTSLLLGGTSLATTSILTVTQTVTDAVSTTAPSSVAPHNTHNSTSATKMLQVYDLFGLHGTITPDASIITANPTATVFKLACPLATLSGASSGCAGLETPLTVTEGSKDIIVTSTTATNGTTKTLMVSCDVKATTAATCVAQEGDNTHKNATLTSTYTMSGTNMLTQIPARITAGSFKIGNGTNPFGTGAASGSGAAKPTFTTTTGNVPPKPTSTPAPSHGAGVANAPMIAGVGSIAGLLMAMLAL